MKDGVIGTPQLIGIIFLLMPFLCKLDWLLYLAQ